ncbi:MAG: PVC-type heme-binding CxxCH protein [Opitutus sp.]
MMTPPPVAPFTVHGRAAVRSFILGATILLTTAGGVRAQSSDSMRTGVWTPEQERAGFTLPEGFVIELVASEAGGVIKPIDLSFDDAGRLWTQTASMYPMDPYGEVNFSGIRKIMERQEEVATNPAVKRFTDLYEGRTKGADKILIIDHPDGEQPSTPHVWADGLAIPQSILPYRNGAYVAQGSELFFLDDTDADGRADQRTRLLTNFGVTDSHTLSHVLIRSPGDWIHFSQGALNMSEVRSVVSGAKARIDYCKIVRMSLDGARFNVVTCGLNNIWGLQLRANGQWYGTEANDLSWSVVPMEPGTGFRGIGNDRIRPYQPWFPELHKFRVGGTGISGLEFADGMANGFPSEWSDVALLANPITSTINCVRVVRNPDGTVSAEHLPDLLKSKDDWFRPVHLEFGPDGCLYVADWYNKIVSHNEVPRTHPDRDNTHGRIWRIRHVSQKRNPVPNLVQVPDDKLVRHLSGGTRWEKRAAWHQITDRHATQLAPELVAVVKNQQADVATRIHALWSLEGLKHFDAGLIEELLRSREDDLRREAVRSLLSFGLTASQLAHYVSSLADDPNVMVRSQVLRSLVDFDGEATNEMVGILVRSCRPELPGNALGGPYERKFERFLARMALEKHGRELMAYLDDASAANEPAANRFWAIQALPLDQRERYFIGLWSEISATPWDVSTYIEIVNALGNPAIRRVVEPYFLEPAHARTLVALANDSVGQVAADVLPLLLKPAVQQLLRSKEKSDRLAGLQAADRYGVRDLEVEELALIDSSDREVTRGALVALQRYPSDAARVAFERVFENPAAAFELKLTALNAMIKTAAHPAAKSLERFLGSLSEFEGYELTSALSSSKAGGTFLLSLLESHQLAAGKIDNSTLVRLLNLELNSERLNLLKRERDQGRQASLEQRLQTFTEIARSEAGDSKKGRAIFTVMCLSCHRVGEEGVGFAPPLDGAGYRDEKALLTAILNPDAAIEYSYIVRRIQKNDGSTLEGFLEKQDDRGVTLRMMGGASVFVGQSEVKALQVVMGRSVMPEGLIDHLPPGDVADLLAYIRTLK